MWFGKSALGNRNGLRLRIYGSQGSLEWQQTNPEELLLCRADGSRTIIDRANNLVVIANQKRFNRFKSGHPAGYIEAFANLYTDLADCLAQYQATGYWQSPVVATTDLDVSFLQFCEAMTQSVTSGQWEQTR
jgi:predicted dehydrogenase